MQFKRSSYTSGQLATYLATYMQLNELRTYCICQNIQGGKLLRFINNVHYVGKTFAVSSLKAHARLCNMDFRVCAN